MIFDYDHLASDWFEKGDPDKAVAEGRRFMEGVRDGLIDPVCHLPHLELAAEPLWDWPEDPRDRGLVLTTVKAAEPAFRAAELSHLNTDPGRRLELRARPTNLRANAEHRAGEYRASFESSYGNLFWIENVVGGPDALRDWLSRPTSTVIAEQTIAFLGIFPAAIRRAGLPATRRDQFVQIGRSLVRAYLSTVPEPIVYPATPALAAQWFYLCAENVKEGRPEDAALLESLYALDVRTRPTHHRAQATTALRDVEYARFRRDLTAMEAHRLKAIADLAAYPLPRHRRVVDANGYLAA